VATVITDVFVSVLQLQGLSRYQSGIRQAAGAWGEMEGRMGRLERLQRGATVGAATFGTVLGAALNQAAKFEQTEIGFESILGSAEAARKKLDELKKFAKLSPFNFQESAQAAQTLLAMGVAADKLIPIMTGVGNATAAAGKGTDVFLGALTAIGQIKTKGTVYTEELRQLEERGIPASRVLQRELGLSAEQMKDLGRNGIEADKAIDALVRGWNRDSPNAMERQSKTLLGRISTMEDETQEIGRTLAHTWVPALAEASRHATKLAEQFNKFSGTQKEWVSKGAVGTFGVLAGTAILASTIKNVRTIASLFGKGGAAAGGAGAATGAAVAGAGAVGVGILARMKGLWGKFFGAGGGAQAAAGTSGGLPGVVDTSLAARIRVALMKSKFGMGLLKGGGIAGMLGLPLGIASAMMGEDSKAGKGLGMASWGLSGLALGSRFGPWGMLAGGAAGLGIGAWQAGMFGGGKDAAKQEEKKLPNVLNRLVDALNQNTDALKHKDLNAGVGSDDVIDVMGEARVLRLLAGKMAAGR
jgi:tape measure domain-containing protein